MVFPPRAHTHSLTHSPPLCFLVQVLVAGYLSKVITTFFMMSFPGSMTKFYVGLVTSMFLNIFNSWRINVALAGDEPQSSKSVPSTPNGPRDPTPTEPLLSDAGAMAGVAKAPAEPQELASGTPATPQSGGQGH